MINNYTLLLTIIRDVGISGSIWNAGCFHDFPKETFGNRLTFLVVKCCEWGIIIVDLNQRGLDGRCINWLNIRTSMVVAVDDGFCEIIEIIQTPPHISGRWLITMEAIVENVKIFGDDIWSLWRVKKPWTHGPIMSRCLEVSRSVPRLLLLTGTKRWCLDQWGWFRGCFCWIWMDVVEEEFCKWN